MTEMMILFRRYINLGTKGRLNISRKQYYTQSHIQILMDCILTVVDYINQISPV